MSPLARLAGGSLRRQLVLGVALVHALLITVLLADLVLRQRGFLRDELGQRTTRLAEGLSRHVTSDVMAGDLAALQEAVDGLVGYPEMKYAFVVDPAGRVLAHSDPRRVGGYVDDERSRAMLGGAPRTYVVEQGSQFTDIAVPIEWRGRSIGWVRMAVGSATIERATLGLVREGALYAVIAIVLGTAFAWWTARRLTARLYAVIDVAEATRDGRRDLRAPPTKTQELARLSNSLNSMLDALADRERQLARTNEELEARVEDRTIELADAVADQRAILEQANDAFISIDAAGHVVEWNRMARTTFGWTRAQALGRPLAELIIPPALREAHAAGMARYLAGGEAHVIGRRVELTAITQDGREIPVELSMRVRRRGELRYFDAFVRDITERRQLQESLAQQALHDALTGLPNRRFLLESLPGALQRADRAQRPLALFFLDLDGFKEVNDSLGHEAGDHVLRTFASRIGGAVRAVDMVARLAGDEFVVLAEMLHEAPGDAVKIAGKILRAAEAPYEFDETWRRLSSSIGIALYAPGSGVDPEMLIRRADEAMYASKNQGKGRATLWAETLAAAAARRAPTVA